MFKSTFQTIEQFQQILLELPEGCYAEQCKTLSNATIGQHTRHIIELYQCLLEGYEKAVVCYDKRRRDTKIEQNVNFAVSQLQQVSDLLEKPDKELIVNYDLNELEVSISSNYYREVMYNLEHTIHHQALIKIAINHFTDCILPDSFGVAPSTMQYRNQCVQ